MQKCTHVLKQICLPFCDVEASSDCNKESTNDKISNGYVNCIHILSIRYVVLNTNSIDLLVFDTWLLPYVVNAVSMVYHKIAKIDLIYNCRIENMFWNEFAYLFLIEKHLNCVKKWYKKQ